MQGKNDNSLPTEGAEIDVDIPMLGFYRLVFWLSVILTHTFPIFISGVLWARRHHSSGGCGGIVFSQYAPPS